MTIVNAQQLALGKHNLLRWATRQPRAEWAQALLDYIAELEHKGLCPLDTQVTEADSQRSSLTCSRCGKTVYPHSYSRNLWLGTPPTVFLDGSTNYCTCDSKESAAVALPETDWEQAPREAQ